MVSKTFPQFHSFWRTVKIKGQMEKSQKSIFWSKFLALSLGLCCKKIWNCLLEIWSGPVSYFLTERSKSRAKWKNPKNRFFGRNQRGRPKWEIRLVTRSGPAQIGETLLTPFFGLPIFFQYFLTEPYRFIGKRIVLKHLYDQKNRPLRPTLYVISWKLFVKRRAPRALRAFSFGGANHSFR